MCVDVGSTFTKGVLVDVVSGEVLGTGQHPTTLPDVVVGIAAVRDAIARALIGAAAKADRGLGEGQVADGVRVAGIGAAEVEAAEIVACSSAGGGLRLAVVGHERLVTAEAGQRVALSAGGRVVHLSSGPLDAAAVESLRAARPDLILLTGGTDGGNADVVVHNARRLGIARLPVPVVLACNRDAADAAAHELRRRGRTVTIAGNVLPRIGTLEPGPAREAIRQAFLRHVIGGKGLSRKGSRINGRSFAQLVSAPTPDAVLTGVEVLAGGRGLLMVDVGGATTDVYSVVPAEEAGERPETGAGQWAAGDWFSARTVEGDLGVRSGAVGVVEAALAEGLIELEQAQELRQYALGLVEEAPAPSSSGQPGDGVQVWESPGQVGQSGRGDSDQQSGSLGRGDQALDRQLAQLAVLIAVRRHGRPTRPGSPPRPLRRIGLVVGSGGVLRHADTKGRTDVLKPLFADHAGGWAVPEKATAAVDVRYTLFAAGLLHDRLSPEAARRLASAGLHPGPEHPG
nr:glutamate mutase L [Kineosporia rhizophila]